MHLVVEPWVEFPDCRGEYENQALQGGEAPVPAKPGTDRVRRKYELIKAHRKLLPTKVMCRELGVAPIEFYQ